MPDKTEAVVMDYEEKAREAADKAMEALWEDGILEPSDRGRTIARLQPIIASAIREAVEEDRALSNRLGWEEDCLRRLAGKSR